MRDHARVVATSRRNDVHILCRRLWPSDAPALRAHLLRLDPESRADRFMAAISDAAAGAYAERALACEGVAFGAFVAGTLRGLGELRPLGARPGPFPRMMPGLILGPLAEAAFTVERDHRREGLGSRLFRRIVEAARGRGVADLHLRCLNGNGAMRGLALKLGAELHPAGSETEAAIHLDRPTPVSLWCAGLAEAFDLTLAIAAAADGAARAAGSDQAASPGQSMIRSTSSSSSNSSSLPETRPRTEMPAS